MLNRHFLYFCLCSYVHKLIAHIILDSAHIRPKIQIDFNSNNYDKNGADNMNNKIILETSNKFLLNDKI